MIILFMGLPGGGKTLDVVKKILDNLKLGRTVYTNVEGMDEDKCREYIKLYTGLDDYDLGNRLQFLDVLKVKEFWLHCRPGSLIVIDEVHKYFDNRSWASDGNREMNSWASTHRHHGFDVVLVTQHVEKVDKHIRSLIEWTYEYRKITFMGSWIRKKFIKYAFSGDDVGCKPLGKNVLTYDSKLFNCYKSYAGLDVQELGIMKHVNIFRHPVFIALPLVLAFALYMLFGRSSIASGDLFGAQKTLKKAELKNTGVSASKPPIIVEKKDIPGVFYPETKFVQNSKSSDFFKTSTEKLPASVLADEIPCVIVGSVIGVDDVKTEIRKCGDRVEKYIAGVLQSKKLPPGSSEPVLVAKSKKPSLETGPDMLKAEGPVSKNTSPSVVHAAKKPVVYQPRKGW